MKRVLAWVACLALITAMLGVSSPVMGASAKPKIKKGEMIDSDQNGLPDSLLLTYTKNIKHKKDDDGKYPFVVEDYTITSVGKALDNQLVISLDENLTAPASPIVRYKPTKNDPVRAAKGKRKQARKQTFKNVTAATPVAFNHLTVIVEGPGNVTSVPPGIVCPEIACEGDFPEGSEVALAAIPAILPAPGTFTGWEGDCSGTESSCTITMDGSDKTVTAVFSDALD